MSIDDLVQAELSRLVGDLVQGRIEALKEDGRIGRLTEDEVRSAIADYPGKLTEPAPEAFGNLELIQITNSKVTQYAVDFDLWVDGRPSDLTVCCTITVTPEGELQLEIDDIQVL